MLSTFVPSRRSALSALALLVFFALGQVAANAQVTAGQLLISEFRYRGPSGDTDEYVEIYNNTDAPFTVANTIFAAGYGVFSSTNLNTAYCAIPEGTVIPARGHFLCAGAGYSLANYGGTGAAAGNAAANFDLPDNAGLAIYTSQITLSGLTGTRLDSAGPSTELNPLFKEGTGFPTINAANFEYALVRKLTTGRPQDTQNNETDFWLVNTTGNLLCVSTANFQCFRLGAPGPENLSSPVVRTSSIPSSLIAPCVSSSSPPNRVRDTTAGDPDTSTLGTLSIRRRFTNNTGAPVTRLRFRVVDVTTIPAPTGTADLRLISSSTVGVTDPCAGGPASVQGTTLEVPPTQTFGGGFNSTVSAGTVTLGNPLLPGNSIDLQFLLGVQQGGSFRFFVTVDALP